MRNLRFREVKQLGEDHTAWILVLYYLTLESFLSPYANHYHWYDTQGRSRFGGT